jgi:predicted MPP superfamily phosphohydrolase
MQRLLSFALFLSVVLAVLGGAHYYVWVRLVRDLGLPQAGQRALSLTLIVLYLLVPISFFVRRAGERWALPLIWVPSVWMGVLLLLFVVLLLGDAGRLVIGLAQRLADAPPADPERRTALARLFAIGIASITAVLGIAAVRSGLARVTLREVEVRLARLPAALDGTTIVQMTDIHVGPTIRRDFVERIVATANAANADVIAITGDLVDGSVAELREHVAPLGKLRARYGVYFVTGNHEYYSGADAWCAELERIGIRVLRNERVSIGEGAASFDLAGIDDEHAHPDLKRAVAGRDASRALVLLAHQPRAVFEAVKHGVDLQLSGHTHGGQIWPWNLMVRLQQPVVSGLARFGDTQVYVSNGTGYWGPPMRLAAPAEITRLRLIAG